MTDAPQGQRHDRSALVLYGSETGNSQDAAEELGRVAERLHFVTRVSEMDHVEINILLKYSVVIFVVSTTGQGEFPNNARKFWKSLLRKRLPPGCLDHVSFTTFGLGDSSYPKYNWSARKLHKRLEQLGAKEIYPRGEGDEQHLEGIDGTFLPWSIDLGKHLLAAHPLPEGVTPIPSDVPLPHKLTLEILTDFDSSDSKSRRISKLSKMDLEKPKKGVASASTNGQPTFQGEPRAMLIYEPPVEPEPPTICEQVKEDLPGVEEPYDETLPPPDPIPIPDPTEVILVENKRLTPDTHWQDVRELTFIMSAEFNYNPGETVTIYPKNFPEDVQALIDLMDWNDVADKALHFQAKYPNCYLDDCLISGFETPGLYPLERTTLRQLLTHNLDITAIPKRHFFGLIATHSSDSTHRDRLMEFSDYSYTDELYDYTTRPRRSILEVLQDFPSVKIPWQFVCSFFPVIRGRAYSIASGGNGAKYMPNPDYIQVQIIVALVKYRTVLKKVRHGLCSRYLASLSEGTQLDVHFKPSEKFYELADENPDVPLILVAPGTGLAPARALIWEREHLFVDGEIKVGKSYLFYGGRNKDADFFYADEWENHDTLQVEVFTAFSRDQPEKIYVQDIIRKEGQLIERLLRDEDAIIYVCGSSGKMPKAVRDAFIDACTKYNPNGRPRERIAKIFDKFEKDGRYIQETW